ncbi:uncharacterized protein RCC_02250 [Ramularia collo-cygni]|uniref:Uncharacterized protein n=1 Tax=Ramularia collo-cygni TaxID=112498 RepID=A0A2D3UW51_9PEZI|nr:uncharacterized protein RCC_02250 [Ramularia collo-cygni]CZT16407.1 uncharacterized protein RCC_02250 [Ramularia collo-cygni]
MDIYQAATYQSSESLELDFVGLQPRLADFKLRLDNGPQRFVQHKQEGRVRGRNSLLTQVPITRSSGGYIWWYFCQIDRFDFLFFQFEFSQLPNPVNRIEFFFVPERLIPDSWYTSDSEHADFEIAELKEYRFHKDEDGEWIGHIKEVLRQNPHPRRPGMRPARVASSESPEEILEPGDHAEGLPVGTLGTSAHGRAVHAQLMTSKQRDFFYGVMNECAESRSGLLVCLSRSSSSGDFGFILYEWSQPDQDMWRRYQRPPQFMHTLPPAVEMILITYYTRHEECSYQGPPVTAAEFCRINASKDNRLLIWDIGGADTTMLALIPSNDIRPTEAQREKFRSNFGLSAEEWKASTPVLSSLLCTGLQAGEYTISGDLFSCGCSWDRVWRALHKFAAEDVVEHPPRRLRQAPDFRYTVTHVLSRLVCEHHLRSRLEERVPDTEADAEGED